MYKVIIGKHESVFSTLDEAVAFAKNNDSFTIKKEFDPKRQRLGLGLDGPTEEEQREILARGPVKVTVRVTPNPESVRDGFVEIKDPKLVGIVAQATLNNLSGRIDTNGCSHRQLQYNDDTMGGCSSGWSSVCQDCGHVFMN